MMAWQLLWPNYDKDEIRCEDNGMMVDWINDAHTMEFQQRRSHVLITTHPEDVVQAALPDRLEVLEGYQGASGTSRFDWGNNSPDVKGTPI